jgi:hypothetical protein
MASTVADLQKIGVSLSETEIAVEPGETVQLVVTMTNRQESPDRLLIEVEGIDVEWYFIPVSAVNVAAGASAGERVLFRIQRISENRAGSYPFIVRVQAMETGEVGVAQATLILKPYASLQVELSPKRGISTFLHPLNEFEVTVSNQGNREETLELFAQDSDDECTYEFDMDRITLKPGQTEAVPLAMRPKSLPILGNVSLSSFMVTARATSDSYLVGKAHGQMEKRALISPLLGIFLLLLAFGSAAAYVFWPRPPMPVRIEEFTVSQKQVKAGEKVRLNWSVDGDFRQILIRTQVGAKGVPLNTPGELKQNNGMIEVLPEVPVTTYILQVRAKGNQPPQIKKVEVAVIAPPPAPAPKIAYLQADPRVIHVGESVMLTWKTSGAKTLILDPGNQPMSEYTQSQQVMPLEDKTYTLRAFGENPKDKPAEKSVSIRVVSKDACIAEISSFKVVTSPVYIGEPFKLRWQTQYARVVRIESDRTAPEEVATPRGGSKTYSITEPATFKLTATDSAGKSVEKTITVTPKARPIPPPETDPPTDGTTPAPNDGTTNPPPITNP